MAKILITGGSGLLSLNWAYHIRDLHEVTLALHTRKIRMPGVNTAQVDLTSRDALTETVARISPDIVIHAAGLTSVDDCEQNPQLAQLVNSTLAGNVASSCKVNNKKLVHISTDHLFHGDEPRLTEDALPAPVNVYAQTKLSAETEVRDLAPDALIIRTNFFGWGPAYRRSFSDWIIDSLQQGKAITLFDDVHFSPILIDTAVDIVHGLLDKKATGIFNVVSDERLSKYDFAMLLAQEFNFPSDQVIRGKISGLKLAAPRPNDMSLNNDKIKDRLQLKSVSLRDQLGLLRQQWDSGRANEIRNVILEN